MNTDHQFGAPFDTAPFIDWMRRMEPREPFPPIIGAIDVPSDQGNADQDPLPADGSEC